VSVHNCCKPSTTVASPPALSTEFEARNLLFTVVVRRVDVTKVEQEPGQLVYFSQCDILVSIDFFSCYLIKYADRYDFEATHTCSHF